MKYSRSSSFDVSTSNPAFDLSAAAISDMAETGKEASLRNIGLEDVMYKRVPCEHPNQNMAFHVDEGSTAFWLEFVVKFHGGPGDIESVEVLHSGSSSFQPAKHNWGANRMLINTSMKAFKAPYDIKVVSKLNGHAVTANKVIPEFFEPGKLYESHVQLAYQNVAHSRVRIATKVMHTKNQDCAHPSHRIAGRQLQAKAEIDSG
nr:expansin-B3-like isoform X1 [Physcomitrium patens]|eukprot:XP_024380170.1 expansin-B3-like isoform X1 [Physcomitrella patens]